MGDSLRFLLLLLMVFPVAAEEFYGPLRVRDMGPFQLLRLNMLPDHAIAPSQGRYAFEAHLSSSNTFAMDKDVHDYLKERGIRQSIGADDAARIAARTDNAFLFDGSLDYFLFTGHYGFSENFSAYLSLPVHQYSGGFMDHTIESFHDAFGFDSFGRQYISRNQFQALVIVDGDMFYLPGAPIASGLGDPVIGLRYYYPLHERSAVTIEVAHKHAVHDTGSFLSTGSSDVGLQVSWHTRSESDAWYASFAFVHAGRAEPFPVATRRNAPSFNVAWEHRLSSRLNLILQLNGARSVFGEGADDELTANVFQASIGLRQRRGEFVWSYALTENMFNFNNTADLGIHIGFAWLPSP